jgi:hypothetical protein
MACGWIRGGPSCLQTTIAIRAITSASPARSVGGFAAHMPGSFVIQAIAYYGKLAIHPTPLTSFAELWERAAIGPIPGGLVIAAGVLFHGGWAVVALVTLRIEIASRRERHTLIAMG